MQVAGVNGKILLLSVLFFEGLVFYLIGFFDFILPYFK